MDFQVPAIPIILITHFGEHVSLTFANISPKSLPNKKILLNQ